MAEPFVAACLVGWHLFKIVYFVPNCEILVLYMFFLFDCIQIC